MVQPLNLLRFFEMHRCAINAANGHHTSTTQKRDLINPSDADGRSADKEDTSARAQKPGLHSRNSVNNHLAKLNPLSVDEQVVFNEDGHTYHVYMQDGSIFQVLRSTTALVGQCFAPFVARTGTHTEIDADGNEVPIPGTVDKFYWSWKHRQSEKYWPIIKLTTEDYGHLYTDEEAMDKIAESWTHAGEEACRLGTLFHLYCELLWDQEVTSIDELRKDKQSLWMEPKYEEVTKEIDQYHEFLQSEWVRSRRNFRKYRSELSIHYTRDGVPACAGQIDGLYVYDERDDNGVDKPVFLMIDYKRIKAEKNLSRHKRPFRDENGPKMGKGPMAHFPDIEFYHYSLQQSIYTVMLKACTGIDVTGQCYLLRVHCDLDQYQLIKCDDLIQVAQEVLEAEHRHIKTQLDIQGYEQLLTEARANRKREHDWLDL